MDTSFGPIESTCRSNRLHLPATLDHHSLARAAEWSADPKRVGMIGFSAGAMTTLATALRNDSDARADFIGITYEPLGAVQVPQPTPPLFAAIAADDPLMAPAILD